MDEGWYKFYRKLYTKPIWLKSTPEQKVILVALLGKANHKEKEWEWKGKQFRAKPGQFVTSINSIIDMCGKGISEQNVRTALKRFEKYEFLTQEVTKTGRLITIVNWGLYQGIELETNKETNKDLTKTSQRANKDLTDTSQSPNKDLTPNKNDKNIKNVKNDKEREECEEDITQPPSIFFPTKIHERIFNLVGDTGYKTWFMESKIEEKNGLIIIRAINNFVEGVIRDKYLNKLKIEFGKEVLLEEIGGNKFGIYS